MEQRFLEALSFEQAGSVDQIEVGICCARIGNSSMLLSCTAFRGEELLVGGELPLPPAVLGGGSGMVSVYDNLIQSNLANDDGGGLRLLADPSRLRVGA